MKNKLCTECRHFLNSSQYDDRESRPFWRCNHPKNIHIVGELVDGKGNKEFRYISLETLREGNWFDRTLLKKCGKVGAWWEPKNEEIWEREGD